MEKIRVLFMCNDFLHGGIEQYLLNLIDNMDCQRYDFSVALPGKFERECEYKLLDRGVTTVHYGTESVTQQFTQIGRILRKGNYQIIHIMQSYVAMSESVYFLLAALMHRKRKKYRIIVHSHGTEDTSRTAYGLKKTARSLYRQIIRQIFGKADHLAACSKGAGSFMFGEKAEFLVWKNGIDVYRFSSAQKRNQIEIWREKYGISAQDLNVVTVARFSDEKNPFFMLDIIEELKIIVPETRFTWVGDGPLFDKVACISHQKHLDTYVNFLGRQEHVEEVLACCDCFLLPSMREGAPVSLLEAQAAGLGCFISDKVPLDVDCGGCVVVGLQESAQTWAKTIASQAVNAKQGITNEKLDQFRIAATAERAAEIYEMLMTS